MAIFNTELGLSVRIKSAKEITMGLILNKKRIV